MSEVALAASHMRRRLRDYLPQLRRFARSLTGQQTYADMTVITMMDELLSHQEHYICESAPHVAFYRRLLTLLDRTGAQPSNRARQAWLLIKSEELDPEDVMAVMDIDRHELDEMLRQRATEMSSQSGARLLIIEDDPLVAMELLRLTHGLGHTCCGVAETADRALAIAQTAVPDLILSDVQLADGSFGSDAVERIQLLYSSPAIFITAYPELLLTGAKPEPIFLIGKPFKDHSVEVMIDQAMFLSRQG